MKLYDCTPAPSPRRARIFLAEKGIDVETIQVNLGSGEQLSDAFKAINPRCTVPALVLDDGTVLSENVSIAYYLDQLHPEPQLMGATPLETAQILEWNTRLEVEGFNAVQDCFRNKAKGFQGRALSGPESFEQIPDLIERGIRRTQMFIDMLNAHLENRDFIALDRFTFADITALACIDFAGWVKITPTDDHPHLKRWYETIAARPSSKA